MTEIRMSDEGIYALIIKGLIIIISVWIFGMLLIPFVQSAFGYPSNGGANIEFITFSAGLTLVITIIICFITGKVMQAIITIETREKELLVKNGLIFPKESKITYSELKEARLSPTFFDFIDNFFGVSTISIEDSKIIVISGVKKPIDSVKEINDRIAANKRKGITMEDLAKEVKSLRDDVETLKLAASARKTKEIKKDEKEEKPRGKGVGIFGIGPLDEEV